MQARGANLIKSYESNISRYSKIHTSEVNKQKLSQLFLNSDKIKLIVKKNMHKNKKQTGIECYKHSYTLG